MEGVREVVAPAFAQRAMARPIPKWELGQAGLPAAVARQLCEDENSADANPRRNLASFCTTWMEPEVRELIGANLNVNAVDADEYPSVRRIEARCVAMIAKLFHADGLGAKAAGAATIGSSEAIMLCGLAMKMKWQARSRKRKGDGAGRPNLVMGANVQVCWEKFCVYFDVEPRFVPNDEEHLCLNVDKALTMVDENTIGLCVILGSTYTGHFEDVLAADRGLAQLKAQEGWEVPIHVDAASGGFVAPFIAPDLQWDFRVPSVASINVSGHKYGLVYPGVGWAVWRSWDHVPDALVFHTNYLGSDLPTITLNFSKGASHIVAQYYQFLRLGHEGYSHIMSNLQTIAGFLKEKISASSRFIVRSPEVGVPLVAFSLAPQEGRTMMYDEFDLADKLRAFGWIVPAYTMSHDAQHIRILRIVVREDLSMALAEQLLQDLEEAVHYLDVHMPFKTADELKQHDTTLKKKFMLKFLAHRLKKRAGHRGVC